jgi:uncharacterized membrane protein
MKIIKKYALILLLCLGLFACETMSGTQEGALIGTGTGAGAGALIGSFSGNAGIGAGIGAVAGALGGGLIGAQQDKKNIQYVELLINNKEIGKFDVNDNSGYAKVANIIINNKGLIIISGPLKNIVAEKLMQYNIPSNQIVLSAKGDYNNKINISF